MNSGTIVIIRLSVLRIIARSLFLVIAIITLPFVGSIIRGSSNALYEFELGQLGFDSMSFESLPLILKDLANEGLIKEGHKSLFVSDSVDYSEQDLDLLNDNEIDLLVDSDFERKGSIAHQVFDVLFASSFADAEFIDRVLKVNGIVVTKVSNNPSDEFKPLSNYKIVYLCRFDSTVIALRKIGPVEGSKNSQTKRQRRLRGFSTEAKSEALMLLEDALLEPPLRKSINRKMKFLPDLMGDSLESYQRRIFITDGKTDVLKWFKENYPTRNQHFEIYNLEVEIYDSETIPKGLGIGLSDWLAKNVKEEDYVVMKAEAEVVEEMIMEKKMYLVDELFLECKNQWDDEENKSKRAYWQCLELYGRLRDEKVAVHQWWS